MIIRICILTYFFVFDLLEQISETNKANHKLKNNKAAGLDDIPAELFKQGGQPVTEALTNMSCRRDIPEEWREGIIIPLPKK